MELTLNEEEEIMVIYIKDENRHYTVCPRCGDIQNLLEGYPQQYWCGGGSWLEYYDTQPRMFEDIEQWRRYMDEMKNIPYPNGGFPGH